MKNLKGLVVEWMPSVIEYDLALPEIKVYRLEQVDLHRCIPSGEEHHLWYGIYFVSQPASMHTSGRMIGKPSISLFNSSFEFITQQKHNTEEGYLLLLNHRFLPGRVNEKLKEMPYFLDQGGHPFALSVEQVHRLKELFSKITDALTSSYLYKYDLLAILLLQLVHFFMKDFLNNNRNVDE